MKSGNRYKKMLKEKIMYECMWCGERFHEEDAGKKTYYILIHGEEEPESVDVCPYCRSDELADIDDVEE